MNDLISPAKQVLNDKLTLLSRKDTPPQEPSRGHHNGHRQDSLSVWGHTPVITLGRQRQENQEFKANLSCKRPCLNPLPTPP